MSPGNHHGLVLSSKTPFLAAFEVSIERDRYNYSLSLSTEQCVDSEPSFIIPNRYLVH